MTINFRARVIEGNGRGTGAIHFPDEKKELLNDGMLLRMFVYEKQQHFYAPVLNIRRRKGIYIPKRIALGLPRSVLRWKAKSPDGFYAPIAKDGTVYIPRNVVAKYNLKKNDIVKIVLIEQNNKSQVFYKKIYSLQRPGRSNENIIRVSPKFCRADILFRLEKLPIKPPKSSLLRTHLRQGMNYAFTKNGFLVLFQGNKVPVIVNPCVSWEKLARYLGAYFSDGTKKGNSWAITASTFLQARWYLRMHKELIKDAKPELVLVYTNHNADGAEITLLRKKWETELGQKVNSIRVLQAKGANGSKWNKYGSLVIREPRQILLDVYSRLLDGLIQQIYRRKDKKLGWEFLHGVLEGDGCVPATRRGHLSISTNDIEYNVIQQVLFTIGLKFKVISGKGHGRSIRIGALDLLRNFPFIIPHIFNYYPKRRATFFKRLNTVGAVKFLLNEHRPASWVKLWLRKNGFVNKNYKLTDKGKRLRKDLETGIINI
ncbi:MAG: hypothetical protein HYX22_03595 [Candidatus Yanofskybacteria bacterium]|nr:hypothetical protein [Candidatus Yanofskybacteria bacterium]